MSNFLYKILLTVLILMIKPIKSMDEIVDNKLKFLNEIYNIIIKLIIIYEMQNHLQQIFDHFKAENYYTVALKINDLLSNFHNTKNSLSIRSSCTIFNILVNDILQKNFRK